MTTAREILYDDCASADKLAREWTRILGADNLTVEYQVAIGKFAYTITRAGGAQTHQWKWMTAPPMAKFEASYIYKKNNAAPNTNYGGFGLLFDCIDTNNNSNVAMADSLYFTRTFNSAWFGKWWAFSSLNDVWYNIKIRKIGRDVRLKKWQYGTQEPDWQFTNYTVPGGSTENPIRFQLRPDGRFGISTILYAVGDYCKISDIRITPVPKTGGP